MLNRIIVIIKIIIDNDPCSQLENSQKVYLSFVPDFAAIAATMMVHGANQETTSYFSIKFKEVNNLDITLYEEESGLINFAMTIAYPIRIPSFPINGAPKNISKTSFNIINPTTIDAMISKVFTVEFENIR